MERERFIKEMDNILLERVVYSYKDKVNNNTVYYFKDTSIMLFKNGALKIMGTEYYNYERLENLGGISSELTNAKIIDGEYRIIFEFANSKFVLLV